MRTFRYSKEYPEGKIFDTTGQTAPLPPSELNGWFDTPAKLHITQDQLIDAVVRRELAKQDSHRPDLEREIVAKHGVRPSTLAQDKKLENMLDAPVVKRGPGRPKKIILT